MSSANNIYSDKTGILTIYKMTLTTLWNGSLNKINTDDAILKICWYHALIIKRKRFKTLGWNIIYDFKDSDWDTANNILQIYINHTE
jgi:hypothetical protein